ncbi:hypothetical protein ACJJTC_013499 [Scirpophaga incertulas]
MVLTRLLDVTLTLSTCNLAFRGHKETVYGNDSCPKGIFLSIVELLAKYDPILQELLSKPKGQIKYLSPKIQNELISVLVQKVENALRLSNLAILSIENSMARNLNFDDVINTFAEQKVRRKEFK